ncbi:MAG: V-type ATP synthase subunit E [Christensenellales bacterium]|jgi:vacuolar-type H+-ATPase subunit E/Vma4|nr:V-type ATP synthase subunit E family protein [Eubacteriales bacterium]
MNGKEAIIEKILSDAEAAASAVLAEAKEKSDAIINGAREENEAYTAAEAQKSEKAAVETLKRSRVVAALDGQKILLKAKSYVLDKAFDAAFRRIRELKPEAYLKLVSGMLGYAEDGDTVTIAKEDKALITESFIADHSKRSGKKLTLSKHFGDFKCGIMLTSGGVDKNLTLESEIKALRAELEGEAAAILFGDLNEL